MANSPLRDSPRKKIRPRRPKLDDLLVGPRLIERRQTRFAFLIVTNAAPVPTVDVDVLKCGLQVERDIRVFLRGNPVTDAGRCTQGICR